MFGRNNKFLGQFVTQRTGKAFGWDKLSSPWAPSSFTDRMKSLEKSINSMLAAPAPGAIPPIDWQSWRSQIKTPGVVDTIKTAYEEEKKKLESGTAALDEKYLTQKAEMAKKVDRDQKWAEFSAKELASLKAKRADLQTEQKNILNWDVQDFYDRYPGLLEQHRKEAEEEDWGLTEEEDTLTSLEYTSFRNSLNEGKPAHQEARKIIESLYDGKFPKSVMGVDTEKAFSTLAKFKEEVAKNDGNPPQ